MIRAGRNVLTAPEAAARCGYVSLLAAQRDGLFKRLPRPVNQHGPASRNLLWDAGQVDAVAQGKPVPEIPQTDHPDDLLDQVEAAAHRGVSEGTWDGYRRTHPHLIPKHQVIGKVRFWRRGDLDEFERPGKGAGAGRPAGAKDSAPRSYLSKEARLAQVAEMLEADPAVSAKTVAEAQGVSEPYARNLLRDARSSKDQA